MTVGIGGIFAGYRLLGWLFPTRPLAEVTSESYEALCLKYKTRDFWGNWIGFFAYCFLVVFYFVLLLGVGYWITSGVPKEHYVGPFEFLYLVMSFFLSLVSSTYFVFSLYRLGLGKVEYDRYMAYGGEKIRRTVIGTSIHFGKAFAMFFWVFMPPLMLLMVAYMDNYASFTEQNIIINPFWSLGQKIVRPYSDVAGLYEVRGIHTRQRDEIQPYHVIQFADRTRWESDHGSLGPKLQGQRELMAFAAQKSGKPVTTVNFEENIPPR